VPPTLAASPSSSADGISPSGCRPFRIASTNSGVRVGAAPKYPRSIFSGTAISLMLA